MDAEASGDHDALKLWQQLQDEVHQWKFTPFERNGVAVTAEVEEYMDLVPPEKKPKVHLLLLLFDRTPRLQFRLKEMDVSVAVHPIL